MNKEATKPAFLQNGTLKKVTGALLLLVGFIALITPFTPGSWLIFVGAELLGLRLLFLDKLKSRFQKK